MTRLAYEADSEHPVVVGSNLIEPQADLGDAPPAGTPPSPEGPRAVLGVHGVNWLAP